MTKKEKAIELVQTCDEWGFATVAAGVFLETSISMQAQAISWHCYDQGRLLNLAAFPYWLTTDSGTLPVGIMGVNDPDLFNAIEQ